MIFWMLLGAIAVTAILLPIIKRDGFYVFISLICGLIASLLFFAITALIMPSSYLKTETFEVPDKFIFSTDDEGSADGLSTEGLYKVREGETPDGDYILVREYEQYDPFWVPFSLGASYTYEFVSAE